MIYKLLFILFSTILLGCSNQTGLYFDDNARELCERWANHVDTIIFENKDKNIHDTLVVDKFYRRQPDIAQKEKGSQLDREKAKIKYRLIHNHHTYAITIELIADTADTSVNLTVDDIAYSPKNHTALPALLFEKSDSGYNNEDKPKIDYIEVGPDNHGYEGYMSGILGFTINGVKMSRRPEWFENAAHNH